MGWVFLEIVAALAVAAVIVWWTMPRKPRHGATGQDAKDDPKRDA